MKKVSQKFRNDFILILQTGALTCDFQYKKRIAHNIVSIGLQITDELFIEKDYDVYAYVCDILDFEYGLFDQNNEEYPPFVKRYWDWKTSLSK